MKKLNNHGYGLVELLIVIAMFAVVGATIWLAISRPDPETPEDSTINSFEDCVNAGYPVAESYPRQCYTPEGQHFVEEIDEPISPPAEEPSPLTLTSSKGVEIIVTAPLSSAVVTSPLKITGKVPGSWSFEASFPIVLKDANGKILGRAPAALEGDWMTSDMVKFSANLKFKQPTTQTGILFIEKSNPSGMPKHSDQAELSVKF